MDQFLLSSVTGLTWGVEEPVAEFILAIFILMILHLIPGCSPPVIRERERGIPHLSQLEIAGILEPALRRVELSRILSGVYVLVLFKRQLIVRDKFAWETQLHSPTHRQEGVPIHGILVMAPLYPALMRMFHTFFRIRATITYN